MINYFGGVSPETPPFYVHSKKGRGKMLTRIFGAVTGGRLNLRAAANSSAAIIASIPNETLLILSEHNDMEYRVLPHGGEKSASLAWARRLSAQGPRAKSSPPCGQPLRAE